MGRLSIRQMPRLPGTPIRPGGPERGGIIHRLSTVWVAELSPPSRRRLAFLTAVSLVAVLFYGLLFRMVVASVPAPFVGMAMVTSGFVLVYALARGVWRSPPL